MPITPSMNLVVLSLVSRSLIVLGMILVLFAITGVVIWFAHRHQNATGHFEVDSAPGRTIDPEQHWGGADSFGAVRAENAAPVHLADNPELAIAPPTPPHTQPPADEAE